MGRWAAIVTILALLTACGDAGLLPGDHIRGAGDVMEQARTVTGFERVVLEGEGDLWIEFGDVESMVVATDANLHEHLETEVADGTLTIGTRDGADLDPTEGITYRLTATGLAGVELQGAGTINVDRWQGQRISVVLAGAGEVRVDRLAADHVHVVHRGAGTVTVAGTADSQRAVLTGAGGYEGGDLESRTATVEASGATTATVWATHELSLSVTRNSATVRYFGDPAITHLQSTGTVEALGEK